MYAHMSVRIHRDSAERQSSGNIHIALNLNISFDFHVSGNIDSLCGNFHIAARHLDFRPTPLYKDGIIRHGHDGILLF